MNPADLATKSALNLEHYWMPFAMSSHLSVGDAPL